MNKELEKFIKETKNTWALDVKSLFKIRELFTHLIRDEDFCKNLLEKKDQLNQGMELHRDQDHGFILLAYIELKDMYRIPHNHGNSWVLYGVVDGVIQMRNYLNLSKKDGDQQLTLKNSEILKAQDCRVYYPGEIHDTKALSDEVIILRLTSSDLKVEESLGRMQRFKL
jgi:hypothetical protein